MLTGHHALSAHGCPGEVIETECAIDSSDRERFAEHLTGGQWSPVYRTPFFAKFRLLSTGTPVIKVLFLDSTTFALLVQNSVEFALGEISLRIPSLLHLVAMKLQVMKNEPDRSADEVPIIVTLLHANKGRWSATDLENACRRFGPPGIYELIQTLAD